MLLTEPVDLGRVDPDEVVVAHRLMLMSADCSGERLRKCTR
jgi:hypothetical protein